jgi:hypothetical protein
MNRYGVAIICILLSLAGGGCVTRHWVAKEVSGLVVDADAQSPLADVRIYRSIGDQLTLVEKAEGESRRGHILTIDK